MSFSELIWREENADVAQLVARNLAKVQVAGSNPVVRSDIRPPAFHRGPYFHGGMAERRGKGLQIPLHGFKSRFHLHYVSLRNCSVSIFKIFKILFSHE